MKRFDPVVRNRISAWCLLAGIGGGLICFDETLYRGMQKFSGREETRWLSPRVTLLGDCAVDLGIAGLIVLVGASAGDEELKETGTLSFKAIASAGVVAVALKNCFGRHRPGKRVQDQWKGPLGFWLTPNFFEGYAFPSGHAATGWALATVIADRTESRFLDFTVYGLAAIMGLSRVTEKKHWFSDVFAGAVLGHLIGRSVQREETEIGIHVGRTGFHASWSRSF